jgi:formylglycine-generating enzyme required for sulfatase activity
MSDIFISYKREEQAIARKLANALESEGWSVWWDPKLRAGEHFDDVIEKALNEAKCVIVMWSNLAVNSEYIRAEASEALEQKKLVPVKIEDVNLPFRFKRVHTLSLRGWDGSRDYSELRRLVDDISTILGPSHMVVAAEEEAKQKADEEKQNNRALQEARAQRTEEKERLREQERQQSQEELKRRGHANKLRSQQEKVRTERKTEQSREKGQRSSRSYMLQPDESRLQPATVFRDKLKDGWHGPEMVVIPAGTFQMGAIDGKRSEIPVHSVRITKPFAIGRYEVTFDEYGRFAAATGRRLPGDQGWGQGKRPVINVFWRDAVEYAKWVSAQTGKRYRLPSEAEWEYAARSAGKEETWAGTSVEPELGEYVWYSDNSNRTTHTVGGKKPNGLGLHDMSGNVSEWVHDKWHDSYEGAPADGRVWLQGKTASRSRMVRGGHWGDVPEWLRASSRRLERADHANYFIGFRLARDLN